MFFHADNFKEYMDTDTASLVSKLCNKILDENSKVLYGTLFSDGHCSDFGTNKDRTDTHVCLAVDISIMGSFKPSAVTVSLEPPAKQDLDRLKDQRILQLQREVGTLRGNS